MGGIVARFEAGPITFPVKGSVTGGTLVEGTATSQVQTATAGSTKVVGVALTDGVETDASSGTTSYGMPYIDASFPGSNVSVALSGVYKLTFAAAAAFGVRLKAAANGQVTPWVSGTDAADLIIGRCVELAGASAAGTGLVALGCA